MILALTGRNRTPLPSPPRPPHPSGPPPQPAAPGTPRHDQIACSDQFERPILLKKIPVRTALALQVGRRGSVPPTPIPVFTPDARSHHARAAGVELQAKHGGVLAQ